MSNISPPHHAADEIERTWECQSVFRQELAKLIQHAVLSGWREEEVALQLADLADEYIVYLSARPTRRKAPANSNRPRPKRA